MVNWAIYAHIGAAAGPQRVFPNVASRKRCSRGLCQLATCPALLETELYWYFVCNRFLDYRLRPSSAWWVRHLDVSCPGCPEWTLGTDRVRDGVTERFHASWTSPLIYIITIFTTTAQIIYFFFFNSDAVDDTTEADRCAVRCCKKGTKGQCSGVNVSLRLRKPVQTDTLGCGLGTVLRLWRRILLTTRSDQCRGGNRR